MYAYIYIYICIYIHIHIYILPQGVIPSTKGKSREKNDMYTSIIHIYIHISYIYTYICVYTQPGRGESVYDGKKP